MSSPLSASMDQLLDRFDDAWNGPTPPRIEDYLLLPTDAPAYLPMLTELVKIETPRYYRERYKGDTMRINSLKNQPIDSFHMSPPLRSG